MVGLQLLLARLPSVPKDQLFPSGTVLLPAPGEADVLLASLPAAGLPRGGRQSGLSTRLCPRARVTPQLGSTSPFTVAVLCCPAGCWTAGIAKALPAFVLSATKQTTTPYYTCSYVSG